GLESGESSGRVLTPRMRGRAGVRLLPGGRALARVVLPLGDPGERDQLHGDILLRRPDAQGFERFGHRVAAQPSLSASALKARSSSAGCWRRAASVSWARPTSCRSLRTRPAPRAAVVARPSVEAVIAFLPRKAPISVVPIEIAA